MKYCHIYRLINNGGSFKTTKRCWWAEIQCNTYFIL